MAETHYFDINVAKRYGVNCAVILQNLWHWIRKNEANGMNYYDENHWTYNSTKAFADLFPYLSQKQIETALKRLRDEGIIVTGNYNEHKYDRTLWYAITEKGKSILLTGEMEITSKGNGFDTEGEPIPNINANLENTDDKPHIIIIDYLNRRAGTNYRANSKNTIKHINARLTEGYTEEDFIKVIDKMCTRWIGTDYEQYLRPETLFGTKFEGYLNSNVKPLKNKQEKVPQGSGNSFIDMMIEEGYIDE